MWKEERGGDIFPPFSCSHVLKFLFVHVCVCVFANEPYTVLEYMANLSAGLLFHLSTPVFSSSCNPLFMASCVFKPVHLNSESAFLSLCTSPLLAPSTQERDTACRRERERKTESETEREREQDRGAERGRKTNADGGWEWIFKWWFKAMEDLV